MTYILGKQSLERLHNPAVHPDLVTLVEYAIQRTTQDFSVFEAVRTAARQSSLVASGASRTHNSRHLTGHAVDLVAFIGGNLSWAERPHYAIAEAMHRAALELGIKVRWGGCWDRLLNDLDGDDLDGEAYEYAKRCRAKGQKPFLDLVHHELPREFYP